MTKDKNCICRDCNGKFMAKHKDAKLCYKCTYKTDYSSEFEKKLIKKEKNVCKYLRLVQD